MGVVGCDQESGQTPIYDSCCEEFSVVDLSLALSLDKEWDLFLTFILILLHEVSTIFSSKGIISKVWVGISKSTNSETSRFWILKGDSEWRVSNIGWGKR